MIDTASIARLLTALEDDAYPCPGWVETDAILSPACPNQVRIQWPPSGWPVFTGCDLHAPRLSTVDTDDPSLARLLGMAAERKRLRALLEAPNA